MSSAQTAQHKPGAVSPALAKDRLGIPAVLFFVLAGVAPLTVAAGVAGRLGEAGYLARRPARRPWRGERWVPADSDCAFAPFSRARSALDPARQLLVPGAALPG